MFGQRLRHYRRQAGLTLEELGRAAGRPASYLSQVENGHREPKLSTVERLAAAVGCRPEDLLASAPPTRRAELLVRVAQIQEDPRYQELKLPYFRPSAGTDDAVLEHLVALFGRVNELSAKTLPPDDVEPPRRTTTAAASSGAGARAANSAQRLAMRACDNYFDSIERVAGRVLEGARYPGTGAVSERTLTDVAAHLGFTIKRVADLPQSTRSITDLRGRVVYVPHRNAMGQSPRSVIAQTLGHIALGHDEPAHFATYVSQRVAANYFAGALLAPERPFVAQVADAKVRQDISVEDLSELFYISYEMAAHRLTNLITRHFGIRVHFLRSDPEGVLWKAYENDDVVLPSDATGTVEGQRLCRSWGARRAYEFADSYDAYYQYTDTPAGVYFCITHIDAEADRPDAITVGTPERSARWFRGAGTPARSVSTCPDQACCKQPPADAVARWEGSAWGSPRDRSHFVSGLPHDAVAFSPYPGVDLAEVYAFLDERYRLDQEVDAVGSRALPPAR